MSKTITCETFILIDDSGDHVVGTTPEQARERYEEEIQPLADCGGFRLVKVAVKVPLPELVELSGEVPADGTAPALLSAS